eukprot:6196462-Pleurochrysis_carterae.AAC.2
MIGRVHWIKLPANEARCSRQVCVTPHWKRVNSSQDSAEKSRGHAARVKANYPTPTRMCIKGFHSSVTPWPHPTHGALSMQPLRWALLEIVYGPVIYCSIRLIPTCVDGVGHASLQMHPNDHLMCAPNIPPNYCIGQ